MRTRITALRQRLDYEASRRGHLRMQARNGGDGFALFGGFHARHRFAGMYLQKGQSLRTRVALHGPITADDCRALAATYGLVVFCGHCAPLGLEADVFRMPLTVDMDLSLPTSLDGSDWSRGAKANIAKIKRGEFRFDVVKPDRRTIAEFYRTMYSPSMRNRHGNAAYIPNETSLFKFLQDAGSEFLRVWQNNRWVAGALTQSQSAGYQMAKLGWLSGDEPLLKSGVVASIYWSTFQRAAALGYRRVLLGSVEPYLENGVLRHKAHWGGELARNSRDYGEFQLLLEPSHPACRSFLERHSLISRGHDGDFIVFSTRTPNQQGVTRGLLKTIARWYVWRETPTPESGLANAEIPPGLRRWLAQAALPQSR
jgi:hypothetical protein